MDVSTLALVTFAPALLVFLAGCTQLPAAEPRSGRSDPAVVTAEATPAPEAPARPETAPPTQPVPVKSAIEHVEGTVVAIESAGPYHYIEVERADASSSTVVVLGDAGVETGDAGRFSIHGERTQFYSKRLDKTFDTLLFGSPDTPKS